MCFAIAACCDQTVYRQSAVDNRQSTQYSYYCVCAYRTNTLCLLPIWFNSLVLFFFCLDGIRFRIHGIVWKWQNTQFKPEWMNEMGRRKKEKWTKQKNHQQYSMIIICNMTGRKNVIAVTSEPVPHKIQIRNNNKKKNETKKIITCKLK